MVEGALLDGVHVLDLSRAIAGPYCSMLLGDMGADVIKVEPPGGDMGRAAGLSRAGDQSTYFVAMNRNKKSLVLDLRDELGREVLGRLVGWADVLIENFRPGVLERLGFGTEKLQQLNPHLVLCSISGYGQMGPYRNRKGLDLIGQTISGLASITGEPDGPPTPAGAPVSDVVTGLNACVAALGALLGRERRRDNHFPLTTVDVSLLSSTLSMLSVEAASYLNTGKVPARHGGAWFEMFPYDVFPTADGWVAIGSGRDWQELCLILRLDDLAAAEELLDMATRLHSRQALKRQISEATRGWETKELVEALQSKDILSGPVYRIDEVLSDENVQQLGLEIELNHPIAGRTRVLDSAATFWAQRPGSDAWPKRRSPAPLMGEHSLEVMRMLGYTESEAMKLCEANVVGFLPA